MAIELHPVLPVSIGLASVNNDLFHLDEVNDIVPSEFCDQQRTALAKLRADFHTLKLSMREEIDRGIHQAHTSMEGRIDVINSKNTALELDLTRLAAELKDLRASQNAREGQSLEAQCGGNRPTPSVAVATPDQTEVPDVGEAFISAMPSLEHLSQLEAWAAVQQRRADFSRERSIEVFEYSGGSTCEPTPRATAARSTSVPVSRSHVASSTLQDSLIQILAEARAETRSMFERVSSLEEAQSSMQDSVEKIHKRLDDVQSAFQETVERTAKFDEGMAQAVQGAEVDENIRCAKQELEATEIQREPPATVQFKSDSSIPATDSLTPMRRVRSPRSDKSVFEHATRLQDRMRAKVEESLLSSLESSVWELVFLAGSPGMPVIETLFAFFLVSLNVFLQALVCVILLRTFTADDKHNADRWRVEMGHWNKFATSTGRSMVDRLCTSDMSLEISGRQQMVYGDVSGWLAPFLGTKAGLLLLLWCLFVWFLFIVQEFQMACDRLCCILALPLDRTTHIYPSGNGFIMSAMSPSRKISTVFVSVLRIGVAGCIAYAGTVWLAQTDAIEDLLLNAVALVFALDLDEALFQTMCPMNLRVVVEHLEPLPFPRFVHSVRMPWRSFATLFSCFTFLVACLFFPLTKQSEKMNELRSSFCGGNTHFVVGSNAVNDIVIAYTGHADTTHAGGTPPDLLTSVAQDLVKGSPKDDHIEVTSWAQFQAFMKMDLQMTVSGFGKCADILPSAEGFLMAPLRRAVSMSLSSCEDVTASQCANPSIIVRLSCPLTCLCNTPLAGHYFIAGCPVDYCKGTRYYKTQLATMRTEDTHINVLNEMPEWHQYWKMYAVYMHAIPGLNRIQWDPSVVTDRFLSQGCDAINFFKSRENLSIALVLGHFCQERPDHVRRPLRPFCPESCECHLASATDSFCPWPPSNSLVACASVEVSMAYSGAHPSQFQPTVANSNCNQSIPNGSQPVGWYACAPHGYNGRRTYTFTDNSSILWRIRWETSRNLDWGAMFLGTDIGLSGVSKWTLSSQRAGPFGVRNHRIASRWFSPSGNTLPPEYGWLPRNASNSDADCAWHEIKVRGAEDFVISPSETVSCPSGHSLITPLIPCMNAASRLNLIYWGPQNSGKFPKGCYVSLSNRRVYRNAHKTGAARSTCRSICQRNLSLEIIMEANGGL